MIDRASKHHLKPESLEYKRERAVAQLNALGINRASTQCHHVYTNSVGETIHIKEFGHHGKN